MLNRKFFDLKDGSARTVLKLGTDTPIIQWTVKFFEFHVDHVCRKLQEKIILSKEYLINHS